MRKALVMIGLAILAVSCEAFFTNSLLSGLARTEYDLSAMSAEQLAALALESNDPALSASILAELNDQIASGGLTGDDLLEAQQAALQSAIVASGLSTAVSELTSLLTTAATMDPADLTAAVAEVLVGITVSPDVAAALAYVPTVDDPAWTGDQYVYAGMLMVIDDVNSGAVFDTSYDPPPDAATLMTIGASNLSDPTTAQAIQAMLNPTP
jgi:hypothetical protein